jgi:glyoxylase-like metal-dependent hydrolase (beta-lactamase superfamily II)
MGRRRRTPMIFRQLIDPQTSTYTYLLGDRASGQAVLVDPVLSQVDRDIALLDELGLELRYALETHVHADHVTGSGELRDRLGAETVTSADAGVTCASLVVAHGDVLQLGRTRIEARHTPGHTDGDVTYVVRDGDRVMAFTGDTLFIRGCGRTDFQQGDARTLYRSVHARIYSLPDDTAVYPGHDYKGRTTTTVGEEKAFNPRLRIGIDEDAFVDIMDGLHLPDPKQIDVAVPANRACGRPLDAEGQVQAA